MENLDCEKLIDLIHIRPAIWDMRSEDYSNKIVKKRCWEEITNEFIAEDATQDAKREIDNYVHLIITNHNISILLY